MIEIKRDATLFGKYNETQTKDEFMVQCNRDFLEQNSGQVE